MGIRSFNPLGKAKMDMKRKRACLLDLERGTSARCARGYMQDGAGASPPYPDRWCDCCAGVSGHAAPCRPRRGTERRRHRRPGVLWRRLVVDDRQAPGGRAGEGLREPASRHGSTPRGRAVFRKAAIPSAQSSSDDLMRQCGLP